MGPDGNGFGLPQKIRLWCAAEERDSRLSHSTRRTDIRKRASGLISVLISLMTQYGGMRDFRLARMAHAKPSDVDSTILSSTKRESFLTTVLRCLCRAICFHSAHRDPVGDPDRVDRTGYCPIQRVLFPRRFHRQNYSPRITDRANRLLCE